MKKFFHYLKRAVSMPPHIAVQKAVAKARRHYAAVSQRKRDTAFSTYVLVSNNRAWTLRPRMMDLSKALSFIPVEAVREKSRRILAHEFDLLGSGLLKVKHGIECAGLGGGRFEPGETVTADSEGRWLLHRINEKNSGESGRVWSLIEQNYEPIDWQLDFKSGYRWRENVLSRDISYGDVRGVDVKVCWELARMQHLSSLAWAFGLARQKTTLGSLNPGTSNAHVSAGGLGTGDGVETPEVYLREFRNQILDFMATNPPRYGVNWSCAMDVGIRVANWLLAYDLFRSMGASFDPAFEEVFARGVHEHASHIHGHLEWDPVFRSNHYLADIAGLLWASAHLSPGRERDQWLGFAARELAKEVSLQFHSEGGNFEASTSYHRLSAEIVVYSTALLMGLQTGEKHDVLKPFQEDYWDRFEKMPAFTSGVTKPDGRVVQVGDNDSGRFFKLIPVEENSLDHRHLLAAFNGVLDDAGSWTSFKGFEAEEEVTRQLAGGRKAPVVPDTVPSALWTVYPDFGLYRFKKDDWDVIVRCGPVGQQGNGGHAHNDQLSFELALDGVSCLVDPGTYVYTPLPEQRNLFRSTAAHNTLAVEGLEQNAWQEGPGGLFSLLDRTKARMVEYTESSFVGEHFGFGAVCWRSLRIKDKVLEGLDECARPGTKAIYFHLAPGWEVKMSEKSEVLLAFGSVKAKIVSAEGDWSLMEGLYSKAYGQKEPAPVLKLRFSGDHCGWKIERMTS